LTKNNIKIPLHLYDGNELPFADDSFDKVYSCLVFHQLDAETKLKCLIELNRVLKPNGKVIIADWGQYPNLQILYLDLLCLPISYWMDSKQQMIT